MIRYRSRALKVGEVYFDETPDCSGLDIVFYHHRSAPVHPQRWLYSYTLTVDLTQTADDLLSMMNRNTSYQVRRARDRDGITARAIPATDEAIDEFVRFYNRFAGAAGRRPLSPDILQRLAAVDMLTLTCAESPTGERLVCHSLVCSRSQRRVRVRHLSSQLHSVDDNARRALIGRANRYLHYWDMLFFQEQGIQVFDFGGWYAGTEDQARLRINTFKERFGGVVTLGYDCEEPLSLKGKLYLAARQVYWRLCCPDMIRERQRRRRPAPPQALPSRGWQGATDSPV
jgi:hypothetical protein